MTFEDLLTEYEPVAGMYLRKDFKAVAAVAPDRAHIGFLVIEPNSRKSFEGQGIVLEGDVAEHFAKSGTRIYSPFDSPSWFNIGYYLQPGIDDKVIEMAPEHIAAHAQAAEADPNRIHDYLNEFSRIPCEAYAVDTFANKVRNALAMRNLRCNPSKQGLRRQLRTQFDWQIPNMVHDLRGLLDDIRAERMETPGPAQREACEALLDQPLTALLDKSDEFLEALVRKQLLRRCRFEATQNVADFHVSNIFYELARGAQHAYKYEQPKKLNC